MLGLIGKFWAALAGGMVTLLFGPWAVALVIAGVSGLPDFAAVRNLAWGSCGIVGAIGFWVWMFTASQRSRTCKLTLTASLLFGVGAALVPLIQLESTPNIITIVSVIGGITGIAVILSLWVPAPEKQLSVSGERHTPGSSEP